jgi:zinc-ribbon domain
MGVTSVSSFARLGPYLKSLGMVSLLLIGLGMLLEAISGFVDIGYGASQGASVTTGDGVWAALDALLLIISFLTIGASFAVKSGTFPKKMLLGVVLLSSISLIVQGAGMYAISTSPSSWSTAAALAIAGGVVLLLAIFVSMGSSMGMRLTGAIFALAFSILLIARLASLTGAPGGGQSLATYLLLSGGYGYYYSGFDLGAAFTALGTLGFTYLAAVSYLIVALGLLLYAIMAKSKAAPIAWVIALVGFLLYAIDMAWGNIAALANANWTVVTNSLAYTTTPIIAAVVLSVASFIAMAATIIGIIFYGGTLGGLMATQPTAAQPQPTQAAAAVFCPSCGTQNPPENTFCKKCGAKLG